MSNALKQYDDFPADLYAIIACGGKSVRMGSSKSMLVYHDKPQCYHLYNLVRPFCEKVFLSCNAQQSDCISRAYPMIVDAPAYNNIGPMACLLSAFDQYPGKDLFIIGCDYPFLTTTDIATFLHNLNREGPATAFYNSTFGLYEPLLAYYNYNVSKDIYKMFLNKEFSLQRFLIKQHAEKFFPLNERAIESVDTKEDYERALRSIKQSL